VRLQRWWKSCARFGLGSNAGRRLARVVPMHHGTLKRRRLDQVLRHMSGRQVGTASFGLEFGLDIDALQVKSVSRFSGLHKEA
jgi:hypothetical protein